MNFDYKNWLSILKLRLSLNDSLRDNILLDYLKISHENLWTNYYRLEWNEDVESHPWFNDEKTKLAVIHLSVTLFSNPDENLEAKDVKDDRVIMRLLGNRMVY